MAFLMALVRAFLVLSIVVETSSISLQLQKPAQATLSRTARASPKGGILAQSSGGMVPTITRRAKLYCRTGFSLAVTQNNTVRGVNEIYCSQTSRCLFELESYGKSLIRLKNVKSGMFIAINNKGKVFSTQNKTDETLLNQRMEQTTNFEIFSSKKYHGKSLKHRNWYLAIRKSDGVMKKASKTHWLHKSIHFVIMYY